MKGYKIANNIICTLAYGFLLLPLIVIIITSFGAGNRAVFPISGFTFKWYKEALQNKDFFMSIFVSFRVAIVSTMLSTVIGTMVSLYFWKSKGRIKEIGELLFMAPMVVPTVVFGVAFLLAFASYKSFIPYWKLVLSYCAIQIPYIIRSVTAALYGLDASFEEASLVLGASPLRTLFKVTLPCIKRGIISGIIFAFVVAFDEAVLIMFLRSASTTTYPLRLYTHITEQFSPMVSAFSTVFIIVSFVLIYLIEKLFGLSNMYGSK